MKYTYQLYGDREIYSTIEKAHEQLCLSLNKNIKEFLPYKKIKTKEGWLEIYYPNGHSITKRPLL